LLFVFRRLLISILLLILIRLLSMSLLLWRSYFFLWFLLLRFLSFRFFVFILWLFNFIIVFSLRFFSINNLRWYLRWLFSRFFRRFLSRFFSRFFRRLFRRLINDLYYLGLFFTRFRSLLTLLSLLLRIKFSWLTSLLIHINHSLRMGINSQADEFLIIIKDGIKVLQEKISK